MSEGLLTYDDLAARWKAPGMTPEARSRWVRRKCLVLRIKPLEGFGRGSSARFRPANVERAEERAAS